MNISPCSLVVYTVQVGSFVPERYTRQVSPWSEGMSLSALGLTVFTMRRGTRSKWSGCVLGVASAALTGAMRASVERMGALA